MLRARKRGKIRGFWVDSLSTGAKFSNELQSAGAILVVVVVSTRFFEFLRDSNLQFEVTSK